MKYCSRCGKELETDMIMCPYCGTKVEDDVAKGMALENSKSDEKSCPYCGRMIPSVAVACPYCGKKINTVDKKKQILIVALLVVVCALVLMIVARKVQLDKMEETYSQAQLAMNDFDYEKAQQLLNNIPEYKDSQELLQQAQDGEFLATCAQYIYHFILDGEFYNPSAIRILEASYMTAENDLYAQLLDCDAMMYVTIQGTNKVGGTLNKDYVIAVGGAVDGEVYSNEDSDGNGLNDYSQSDKVIDVALINKMLQKYWEDMGIS